MRQIGWFRSSRLYSSSKVWISRASYFDEDTAMVYIRFDPSLKPYLIQLKREFTQASLSTVLPLKSVYAIRLYLLLKQYRGIGKRALSLEEMREMLGIEKIST